MDRIKSLGEFINWIEAHRKSMLFRGENCDYDLKPNSKRLQASLYRCGNTAMPEAICRQFYAHVFSMLSKNEDANFLAFAQHYGIPTNLLDVSNSPLVALYFACIGNKDDCEDGYVYCFDNNFADITKLIDKIGYRHLLDELRIGDKEEVRRNAELLADCLNPTDLSASYQAAFKRCFYDLIKDIKDRYDQSGIHAIFSVLEEYHPGIFDTRCREYEFTREDWIDFLFDHDVGYIMDQLSYIGSHNSFTSILQILLKKNIPPRTRTETLKSKITEYFPRLLYKPLISFNRAVSQQSCFIYQIHQQPHQADAIICIEHRAKEGILLTLDRIGINKSTVFRDFDNIAKYVVGESIKQKLKNVDNDEEIKPHDTAHTEPSI